MSSHPSRPIPLWLQASLVMLLAWAGVAALFGRHQFGDWSQPHWLEGDPLEVYARVKIAAEQPLHALFSFTRIERLGAPGFADWSSYPVPDRLVFVLTGLLARATGLIAAVQLAGAFITGLNAASFYLCARWLRCRWEWALALALVFAFCSYNLRWGITLSLNQTFTFPPLVLLCAWAARRSAPRHGSRSWKLLAAGLGLWLGIGNPYLAYFAGVVTGGALLLGWWRRSPQARRIPLYLFLGCLLACFLVSNAGAIGQRFLGTTTATLPRGTGDPSLYALRLADWVVPPAGHRIRALGRIGDHYLSVQQGAGEFFYNYLGLLGLAGLVLLATASLWPLARRQWRRLDPLLGLAWIIAFGIAGGINSWRGAVGLDLFRAGSRIGIFALIWALFFLAVWLSRQSRRLPRSLSITLAGVLALAACWEETPPLQDRTEPVRLAARWSHVRTLTRGLQQALPPGAAVFQLPVVPFPEAGRTLAMPDYEHLLPMLASEGLRFSYGHLRQAPALHWAQYVSQLPADQMVAALERAGFAAIWLDERAYADRGETLIQALHRLPRPELGRPDLTLPVRIFALKPAAQPESPDYLDPRMQERWLDQPDTTELPLLLARQGWFPLERLDASQWRWATREAALGLWSEAGAPRATLRFRLGGLEGSTVILSRDDREVHRLPVGPQIHTVAIPLAPGLTTLKWRLQGATFKPGGRDPRELGFMVENLSLSVP